MASSLTVLFTSAGRRVELINLFRADAAALGVTLRVLAADLKPEYSAACQVADGRFAVPLILDPGYVEQVRELCAREQVTLLVPLHDGELPLFAAARDRFAASGTRIVVSSAEVVAIARDKLATARALAAAGISTPRTARLDDVLAEASGWTWPVIAKPAGGSASIGVHLVPDRSTLATLAQTVERSRYLVQEYCAGREYTVNVFFSGGQMRCAVPHQRLEVRAGEVSKGRTERRADLTAIARQLAVALPGADGPLCFQGMVDGHDRASVFEVNARFGGGFPLAHRAGATFPRWLMEDVLGRDVTAHDTWRSGVLMLRHDTSIFSGGES